MLNYNTELIKDAETRTAIEHIIQEGVSKLIELESAPTADTPLLAADEMGVYNDKIYIRKEGKIYRLDPAETITVT